MRGRQAVVKPEGKTKRLRRLACVLLCILMFPLNIAASEAIAPADIPSRLIHVVYDDSGSMYGNLIAGDKVAFDTWCYAKYSMEVFAAMLGETDRMNIYYMSDYQYGTTAGPRLQLDGRNGAQANVAKVHDEKTTAQTTPFNSVRKAYSDLSAASADEKWLIILTDGYFNLEEQGGRDADVDVDAFLAQKASDINVMYLGMGAYAGSITAKPNQGIYYFAAETSSQILNNITDICSRVFNTHKLEVNVGAKTVSFDVPMSELTVFAQGANVSIDGIKRSDGTLVRGSGTPVAVQYSECDATNSTYNNQPDRSLMGKIEVFTGDFPGGNYTLDVSGAETIEIYYKTNIEIAAYLTDSEGNEMENLSNLPSGEYTLSFGFVKAGTNERVPESALLGDVSYQAVVTNNGVTDGRVYQNGDRITLEEGTLSIDVTAVYLDYYSVTTNLTYDIVKDKTITFSVLQDPDYTVESEGFSSDDRILIEAKIDGEKFTAEQWAAFEPPEIQLVKDGRDFKIDLGQLEKTDQIGVLQTKPVFPGGKPSTGTYRDVEYEITCRQSLGSETWQGGMTGTVKLQDNRSWWERNWGLFVRLVILGVILAVLAGYLPLFKHYLPKTLKRRPYITCTPTGLGQMPTEGNGKIEKSLASTLIPYRAQRGTIKYVPLGAMGFPIMKVKALRRRRMLLLNTNMFSGHNDITFDGEPIEAGQRKFEFGAGVSIQATRDGWSYECCPNQ